MHSSDSRERRCERCRRGSPDAFECCLACHGVVDCTTVARAVLRRVPPRRW
jgi:hypothetical protein